MSKHKDAAPVLTARQLRVNLHFYCYLDAILFVADFEPLAQSENMRIIKCPSKDAGYGTAHSSATLSLKNLTRGFCQHTKVAAIKSQIEQPDALPLGCVDLSDVPINI
jgi:hypothetical protein